MNCCLDNLRELSSLFHFPHIYVCVCRLCFSLQICAPPTLLWTFSTNNSIIQISPTKTEISLLNNLATLLKK